MPTFHRMNDIHLGQQQDDLVPRLSAWRWGRGRIQFTFEVRRLAVAMLLEWRE